MTKFFSEVFERDNRRCVYCGRDLMVDFDTFMMTEEDHLVPKGHGGRDNEDNIVTACAVCNRLKGAFIPDEEYSIDKRAAYITKIRAHIANRRAERMRDYISWTHREG